MLWSETVQDMPKGPCRHTGNWTLLVYGKYFTSNDPYDNIKKSIFGHYLFLLTLQPTWRHSAAHKWAMAHQMRNKSFIYWNIRGANTTLKSHMQQSARLWKARSWPTDGKSPVLLGDLHCSGLVDFEGWSQISGLISGSYMYRYTVLHS